MATWEDVIDLQRSLMSSNAATLTAKTRPLQDLVALRAGDVA
jgi:hypothetical protein